MSSSCIFFSDVPAFSKAHVGGKAWNLGELWHLGVSVPPGFVIPTSVTDENLSPEIEQEILTAADQLETKFFAVRSSATVEDSNALSFAGQFQTSLGVKREQLIEAIKNCWQSTSNSQSDQYLVQNNVAIPKVSMAVIVQALVPAEYSGIAFTAHPVTGNQSQIVVEGGWGLGEALVTGQITPTTWVIDKESETVTEKIPGEQSWELVNENGELKKIDVNENKKNSDPLSEQIISQLITSLKQIETRFGTPQDVEWTLTNNQLFILQSRPITMLQ